MMFSIHGRSRLVRLTVILAFAWMVHPAVAAAQRKAAMKPAVAKKFYKLACEYLHLRDSVTKKPSAKSEKRMEAIVQKLAEHEQSSWAGLRAEFLKPWKAKRSKKKGKIELRYPPPELEGTYYIVQPGRASSRKPSPLVIALHGGSRGVGDPNQIMGLMGNYFLSKKCIVAAPKVPPEAIFAEPISAKFVREIIWEVSKNYNVDLDRVYVTGHSLGGVGAWYMPVVMGDMLAATSTAAGNAPAVSDYELLYNFPVFVVHGSTDIQVTPEANRKTAATIKEIPQENKRDGLFVYHEITTKDPRGHALPMETIKLMAKWKLKFRRDPYPKRVICVAPTNIAVGETPEPMGRSYWCELLQHGWKAKADGRYLGDNKFEFDVSGNPTNMTLYLTDDMVDLDKPVIVTVNGRTVHEGRVKRSAKFLLDHIHATRDRGRVYANKIVIAADEL